MTDIRKNLIVLTFVLGGTLITLLVLNFQELEKKQKAQILGIENGSNNLPIKISKGIVNSFDFKGSSNKIIFYEKLDSMVYEIELDGKNKKELARIPGVSEIVFSSNGKEFIATIKNKNELDKTYFNLETNQRIKWDKRVKSVVFSPDNKSLAYFFYNEETEEGNISISKPNGSDFINILKTRNKNLKLLWPENDLIILLPETENNQSLAFSIKPDGKEFQKLLEAETLIYFSEEQQEVLKNLGIETSDTKLSPLKDYLIFINAKDRKLYSLKI